LQPVLEALDPLYQAQHPGLTLTYSFGASGTLQQQISQGAPVDGFIAAAPEPIDRLAQQGRVVPGSQRDLATNQLVVVTPQGQPPLADFRDLAQPTLGRIALGEPRTVPLGQYSQEVLQNLGIWEEIQPKVVWMPQGRSVLAAVETGNVDAAIVYRSDALGSAQVTLGAVADPSLHRPIRYVFALIQAPDRPPPDPNPAATYGAFLQSPPAQALFRDYGFGNL